MVIGYLEKRARKSTLLLPEAGRVDQREFLLQPTNGDPDELLVSRGGKWLTLPGLAERSSPWWLPPGASFVLDLRRGHFYWGGAEKTSADLTAESVGYTMSDVSWMDPTVGFTLMIEWDTPDAANFNAVEQIFALSHSSAGNRRFFVTLRSESTMKGQPRAEYQDASQYLSAIDPLYRLPHLSDTPKMLGRRRFAVAIAPGEYPLAVSDGMPVNTGSTAITAEPVFNRVHVGYGKLAGTVQTTFEGDVPAISVFAWPYAMTEVQLESLMANSFDAIPPLHTLGDSYGNGQSYSIGGAPQDRIRKRVKDAGRYLMFSDDSVGSNTILQHAERFDVYERYYDSTLLIIEGGFDPVDGGPIPPLEQMVSRLSHNRWAIIEPCFSPFWHTPAQDARTTLDGIVSELRAYCGNEHFISTKAGMQAANDGSANDLIDVANGCWPRSLMGDNIHLTAAGWDVLAGIIFNSLAGKGWA